VGGQPKTLIVASIVYASNGVKKAVFFVAKDQSRMVLLAAYTPSAVVFNNLQNERRYKKSTTERIWTLFYCLLFFPK
jgi:hypothetical protein